MTDKLAVIGSNGFVGKVMCLNARKNGINVVEVTRQNYQLAQKEGGFDYIINCSMPSGRFWAKNNPSDDFQETVQKTFNIKTDFAGSKVIQISSISARLQRDTIYGRHKLSAEALLEPMSDLIIRLGPLYHSSMSKGALIDIINNQKVFLSGETKYAFTPLEWACSKILENIDQFGLLEVGAKGYVTLKDLAAQVGSKSIFEGDLDDQFFLSNDEDRPSATDVVDFARARVRS